MAILWGNMQFPYDALNAKQSTLFLHTDVNKGTWSNKLRSNESTENNLHTARYLCKASSLSEEQNVCVAEYFSTIAALNTSCSGHMLKGAWD